MRTRFSLPALLVIGVLSSLIFTTVHVFAARFSDVPEGAWYFSSVEDAASLGIVSGYKDIYGNFTGRFGPGNTVTIGEALKIALESAGYDTSVGIGYGHWAAKYVSLALGLGFQFPSNAQISMDRAATRAEVAAMMTDAFKLQRQAPRGDIFVDVAVSTLYNEAIEALESAGVITGDTDAMGRRIGRFRPHSTIVRAEVVKMAMEARARLGTPGRDGSPFPSSRSSFSASSTSAVHSSFGQCTINQCGYPPAMPNWQCPDGSIAGPSCERLPDNRCGWLIRQCPLPSSRSSSVSSSMNSSFAVQTHLVTYTGSGGFRPSFLVVRVGDIVKFRSDSETQMWVASNPHPTHTDYSGLDAGRGYSIGQEYQFTFTRVGTWGYHNHLKTEHQGVIAVDPR